MIDQVKLRHQKMNCDHSIKDGNIPSTIVIFIIGFLAANVNLDIVYAVKITRNVPNIQLPAATKSVLKNHLG